MKILITIDTDSELIAYEAMALAMLLASFDHIVQLQITTTTLPLLLDASTRIYGMLQSLPLYDMSPVWVEFSTDELDIALASALNMIDMVDTTNNFNSTLVFR